MKEYGVTSGDPISLKDIVLKLEDEIGKKINVNWGGRPYRNREVMVPWNSLDTIAGWFVKKKNFIC
jgi:hypothetical protein